MARATARSSGWSKSRRHEILGRIAGGPVAAESDRGPARPFPGYAGDASAAVAFLRKVQRRHPGDFWINHYLAWHLDGLRPPRVDEQIRFYTAALAVRGDSAGEWLNLGKALGKKHAFDEALAAYHRALQIKPDYAMAYNNIGSLESDRGNFNAAKKAYRDAIRCDPNSAWARYNLGTLLLNRNGRLQEAADVLRAATRLDPDLAEAHCNLGLALAGLRKYEESISSCRRAIQLNPNLANAHMNLANSLRDSKKYDSAIASYRDAIHVDPEYAEAHCNLGLVLQFLGKYSEGLVELKQGDALGTKKPSWNYPSRKWVKDCERLVDLDRKLKAIVAGGALPDDAGECMELARFGTVKAKIYAAAARLCEKALELDPKSANDLRTVRRYNAASIAALAGAGLGKDAAAMDDRGRTRWRQQARDWLRTDLKLWEKKLGGASDKDRREVELDMRHWLANRDLAGIRDDSELKKLPEAEQTDCRRLWADVRALAERARRSQSQ